MSTTPILAPVSGSPLAPKVDFESIQRSQKAAKETAREFEGLFLSMLLKEMRQTLEDGGLFPGDSGDIHGGLFDHYLGKHLADTGGIGMAKVLEQQLLSSHRPTHAGLQAYQSGNDRIIVPGTSGA